MTGHFDIAAGNEYESPWDLESEINQVVKQMQNPVSPLALSSTHSSKLEHAESPPSRGSSMKRSEPVLGHKVDYDSMSGPSHRIKQPSVHRQGSAASRKETSPPQVNKLGSGRVLVEGEWRYYIIVRVLYV